MPKTLINADISTQVLRFKPGQAPANFEVKVVNESDRFATFQLEVLAAGANPNRASDWYVLSPEISTKKPPGDVTQFRVSLIDTPVPGFIGTMNLTVRVFSMELQTEERLVLRLIVAEAVGMVPMRLELPVREFHNSPNDLLEIPVVVLNPSQVVMEVDLYFQGVNPVWILDGVKQRLLVEAGTKAELVFLCQLPNPTEVPSRVYPFTIEAVPSNGPKSQVEGFIDVIPAGFLDFGCKPVIQQVPSGNWFTRWRSRSTFYNLKLENVSNLPQQIGAMVEGEVLRHCKTEIIPEQLEVAPGETGLYQLKVTPHLRRWVGINSKRLVFVAKATVSDQRLDIRNDTHMLTLWLAPVIHPILQLLALFLLLYLLWSNSFLNPDNPRFGHQDAVNSVELNGLGDRAISASSDQTSIQWFSDGFNNPILNQQIGTISKGDKAVRVVRYSPFMNSQVAVGLENGEVQLWDLTRPGGKAANKLGIFANDTDSTNTLIQSFYFQKDDRVFDIKFSRDARMLFSGHGSGLVLQWDVAADLGDETAKQARLLRKQLLDFAVYGLALVGNDDHTLAIGGRFNRLVTWNWYDNQLRKVTYRPGAQDDYITSVATARSRPYLLATSDTQGYITLRDMRSCVADNQDCKVLDEWSSGHGGKPVRSVALSNNGCYLVSGGDDGRMMLWYLATDGKRVPDRLDGQMVTNSQGFKRINSVDIRASGSNLSLLYGGDDTQVSISLLPRQPRYQCDLP